MNTADRRPSLDTRTRRLCLLVLLAVLCLPAPAGAEEPRDKRDVERDVSTQRHVEEQLQDLQQSMKALADELEKTGHTYEAGLIRSGIEHLGQADVTTAIRSVLAALQSAQPETAIVQSQRVLESLQRLLLILEDRDREFTRNEIMERKSAFPCEQGSSPILHRGALDDRKVRHGPVIQRAVARHALRPGRHR